MIFPIHILKQLCFRGSELTVRRIFWRFRDSVRFNIVLVNHSWVLVLTFESLSSELFHTLLKSILSLFLRFEEQFDQSTRSSARIVQLVYRVDVRRSPQ